MARLIPKIRIDEIAVKPERDVARALVEQLPDGGRRALRDAFEQARRNLHYLADRIRGQGYPPENPLPFAFGHAVVFPDCEYRGPAPPGAGLAIILGAPDLPCLGRRLPAILTQWAPGSRPRPLEKKDLQAIQRAISPAFALLPVLFRQIEEQEERLFRLTEDQIRLLDFLAAHDRAAIEGVAGSGKTMLARA